MANWIDEHREDLYDWISGCEDPEKCSDCPLREVCDDIWEVVGGVIPLAR